MAKFKIGDKVVGNEKANRYTFSCEGYEGKVVRFITDDDSNPEAARCRDRYGADMIIRGKHPFCDGETFDFCVKSDCFDLVWSEFDPDRIIRNGDAMIVFWRDGTKTVVKRAENEPDNDYAAFTAALAIKLFGSNTALKKMIDKKLEYQHKNPKQPKQKPKPKFEVGDIVRTRYGLKFGEEYDNITFLSGMEVENAEITTVDPIDNTYHVNRSAYWYSEKMLALVRKKDDKE